MLKSDSWLCTKEFTPGGACKCPTCYVISLAWFINGFMILLVGFLSTERICPINYKVNLDLMKMDATSMFVLPKMGTAELCLSPLFH